MSAENFFQRESAGILFAFRELFCFLYVVLGSVFAVLACASMLVSVEFHVAKREVCMLTVVVCEGGAARIWAGGHERPRIEF